MSNQSGLRVGWQEEILTSREARELLKIGRTKLWELTRESTIPAYRVGKGKTAGLRYKRSELLAWLDNNRIGKAT
jgi:excisionase family DNA binding protein